MQLQKQFVAANAARIVNRAAVKTIARMVYSRRNAARIVAEIDTATHERALAIVFNIASWGATKAAGIDVDSLFVDADDLAAAAGIVNIPEFYTAPAGATRRQMARLWANFAALKIAPATALEICSAAFDCRRDAGLGAVVPQTWAETDRGFVGRCVGFSDRLVAARGIERPANPIDDEAGDRHPRDEYRIANPTLEAVEPWLHRPCANCGDLTANGTICEPCETMFADEAEARAERELEFQFA